LIDNIEVDHVREIGALTYNVTNVAFKKSWEVKSNFGYQTWTGLKDGTCDLVTCKLGMDDPDIYNEMCVCV